MAESQNYLAQVNQARQRARSGRRGRIDDIVNPMDSAATMDRLQYADVSDFSSGGADAPQMNIAGAIASGGAGTATKASPFRTAAGSNAKATTVSQTQCPGGRCNINRGMTYPGTVVMSESIVGPVSPITASTTPTTVSQPQVDPNDPDALTADALRLMDEARYMSDPSTRAFTMQKGQAQMLLAGQLRAGSIAQQNADTERTAADKAAKLAMEVYADREELREAELQEAQEGSAAGMATRRTQLLTQVAERQLSVQDYVTTSMEAHLRNVGGAGYQPTPAELAEKQASYRSQGFGTLAAGIVTEAAEAKRLAERGGKVDPDYGTRAIQNGVGAIFNEYAAEGRLSGKQVDIARQLYNDMYPALERGTIEAQMAGREQELAGLTAEQREVRMQEIEIAAKGAAMLTFRMVEDEFFKRYQDHKSGWYDSTIGYAQNFLNNLDWRQRGYEKTLPTTPDKTQEATPVPRIGKPTTQF
jgi:hypothetical protein